jgi:hypothetical protein
LKYLIKLSIFIKIYKGGIYMNLKKPINFYVIFIILGLFLSFIALEASYLINLIENPSYERDDDLDGVPDCWFLITNYPNDYYLDSQEIVFGDLSLKIETYCHPGQYVGAGGSNMYYDVMSNTTYTISYYVKTDHPDYVFFHPTAWELDADGKGIRQQYTYIPLSPGWQRKEFTFTTSPYTAEIILNVVVYANFSQTVEDWKEGEFYTSWIDGVQLEEGTTASPFHITYVSCPRVLPATIDIDPNTLELKSEGEKVSCYIELPEGFEVGDIDVSTILLEDTIPAELEPFKIGDHDLDGIPDLMVKFDRQDLIDYLISIGVQDGDEVELTVTGALYDGASFEGSSTIRVINGY